MEAVRSNPIDWHATFSLSAIFFLPIESVQFCWTNVTQMANRKRQSTNKNNKSVNQPMNRSIDRSMAHEENEWNLLGTKCDISLGCVCMAHFLPPVCSCCCFIDNLRFTPRKYCVTMKHENNENSNMCYAQPVA